jgi:DNA polymerase III delta prime subunit
MNQNYVESVQNILKKGGEISPFLLLSSNLEILHADIQAFILQLLSESHIDAQSLFHLQDLGEALKIAEVKTFLAQGNVKPRFAFQVFFIENISRMTLQAQNACLKFFEEP